MSNFFSLMKKILEKQHKLNEMAIFIMDINFNINFINDKFIDLTGISEQMAYNENPFFQTDAEKNTFINFWMNRVNNFKKIFLMFNQITLKYLHLSLNFSIFESEFLSTIVEIRELENPQNLFGVTNFTMMSASHEIRSALNVVVGLVQIMNIQPREGDSCSFSNEEIKKLLLSATNDLDDILNDVLTVCQMNIQGIQFLNLNIFSMQKLLNSIPLYFQESLNPNQISLIMDFDINNFTNNYYGDSIKLKRVFINLISNALKFTPKYGKITMSLKCEPMPTINSTKFHFSIVDTGVGIKECDLERLFFPFSKLSDESYKGTGLGLYLCSLVLKLMKGVFSVSSLEGVGTTFSFSVLLENCSQKKVMISENTEILEASEEERQILSKISLLIVDDDKISSLITERMFYTLGCRNIDKCSSGEECLEMVAKEKYDIILMDITLPGISGIETAHKIGYKSFIVALSAHTSAALKQEAESYGISKVIFKPLKLQDIHSVLWIYLSRISK
jgi:signal transduction histidine kinase/CheY-like chemotaxis protein